MPKAGGDTGWQSSASWEALRPGGRPSQSSDGRWSVDQANLSEVRSGREVELGEGTKAPSMTPSLARMPFGS